MDLKNIRWGEFEIGKIFKVSTGNLLPKEILKKGNIPRITATDNNNGIYGFYQKVNHKNYREVANFISVSFLGSVFYHSYTASLDMKIHTIQIPEKELNTYLAEFLVLCIKRTVSIFSYGDQLSSSDLPKKKILLPINSKDEPDYAFMEQYMRQKEQEKKDKFQNYIAKRILQVKDYKEVEPLNKKEWGEFYLNQIFPEIQRGRRLKKGDHIKGIAPYVSSSALNNGIDGFLSNKDRVRIFKNCLSIANSGSVGATFYQPFSFVASDHITKLENVNFNEFIYLFISSVTKRLSEKYSFNREINDSRIQKEKILLPANKNNQPDYVYMENYIKKLEYEKLVKYLSVKI
ncbi:restriction endonuclease subunit S [Chryseobacterium aquaticum]|uniref:Restriction endonuclease subunit S n=1 Tax=Chryseobacterium aquaticum TaxID=452084 RepID=A0A848N224_9FLAO|nr:MULTISPECIES: restriction endonuclease subunit S [Chryseobacterium]NMR34406.1 restriction endonuclease subunit S [Chryseobacterium aquaticum]NRQ46610.1 restriction endonuclease subunit S [Chryseobacterium sp. C-204]